MKNNKISLFISIAALVGVVLLFIKVFTGSDKKTPDVEQKDSKIVYVNLDSVLISYDLYNALSLQLQQKQTDLENQLNSKMLSLQNRANQLQNQYAQHLITTENYQTQAEKLSNEQLQLQQWQQDKSLELNEDQLALTQRVYDSIVSVVKYINADSKYDIIISNTTGGTLLYGNPNWDITTQVVKILNERVKNTPLTDTTAVN
jgi:outer membrane protein